MITPYASYSVQEVEPDSDAVRIQEDLVSEFRKLDLSANEAKILLFLMSRGTSTASDISRSTGIQRTETYHYISMLLSKGVVLSTFSKPQKYYSLPFNEAVDYLVQTKYHTLKAILQNKRDYQDKFERIMTAAAVSDIDDEKSYQILVGEDVIHTKLKHILAEAKSEVIAVLSERTFASFYHGEVTDDFLKVSSRGGAVHVRTSGKNAVNYLKAEREGKRRIEGLSNNGHGSVSVRVASEHIPIDFVILDGKELVILVDDLKNPKQKQYGIYINNPSIINTFRYVFNKIG